MSPTLLVLPVGGVLCAGLLTFFAVKWYHRSPIYERHRAANGKTILYLIPAAELQSRLYNRIGKAFMILGIGLFIAEYLGLIHIP